MNRIFAFLIFAFVFASCNDFLEEKSQDQVIPKKLEHFQELVYGELISNTGFSVQGKLDLMSDDASSSFNEKDNLKEDRETNYAFYTWKKNIEYNINQSPDPDNMYGFAYKQIVLCNSILDMMKPLDEGLEKDQLLGEIHFFRAFHYFITANLYGVPYVDAEKAKTTKCIPINNTIGVKEQRFTRSTQQKVYSFITEEIEMAVEKFQQAKGAKTSVYRPNLDAACILATRIFLTMKDYENVKKYAALISSIDRFYDLNDFTEEFGTIDDMVTEKNFNCFISLNNPEVVYTYTDAAYNMSFVNRDAVAGSYHVSDDLINLYEENDLRKTVFFDKKLSLSKYEDPDKGSGNTAQGNLRTVEAYLNLIEATAQTNPSEAITMLETLRESRFKTAAPSLDVANITKHIQDERRRELCFEGLRWNDIRRMGGIEIVHDYPLVEGSTVEVWTLKADDAAYTLSLPISVTDFNKDIEQHERPERTPSVETIN